MRRIPLKGKGKVNSSANANQRTINTFFSGTQKQKEAGKVKTVTDPQELKDLHLTSSQRSDDVGLQTPPNKRAKVSETENETSQGEPTIGDAPLTPEQRVAMNQKAIEARMKRMSKMYPTLDSTMGGTWFAALEDEFRKDYFKQLSEFVLSARDRGTVYPPANNVWEWTKHCRIQDVKVVILGQDPYHGPNQAHGLCFSVQKGIAPPPSLLNMYKELRTDIPGFVPPKHGYLIGWAEQGVLLLNAVLTVDAGKANSHKNKGWEKITDAVIDWISKNLHSVVFLLWGADARKKASVVDRTKHHLLECPHPSPLSAHRGFLGCKHFSKCNELLTNSGKRPIDWTCLH